MRMTKSRKGADSGRSRNMNESNISTIIKDVQWFAILCVDIIDNDVRYHRESIKLSINILNPYISSMTIDDSLHTILQSSV